MQKHRSVHEGYQGARQNSTLASICIFATNIATLFVVVFQRFQDTGTLVPITCGQHLSHIYYLSLRMQKKQANKLKINEQTGTTVEK